MHLVDFVRYGSMAAGLPGAGMLYAQLVHDYLSGERKRSAQDLSLLVDVTPRQVERLIAQLEEWGLVSRVGSTRARRVLLVGAPNQEFCRSVVKGYYGVDVLDRVEQGESLVDLQPMGALGTPVADLAVATVGQLYAHRNLVRLELPKPNDDTGKGAVRIYGDVDLFRHVLFCLSFIKKVTAFPITFSTKIKEEQMSQLGKRSSGQQEYLGEVLPGFLADVAIGDAEEAHVANRTKDLPADIAWYSIMDTLGLELPEKSGATRKQRQAKQRRYDVAPEHSNGFMYWPNDKLIIDSHYPTVVDLLAYWNDLVGTDERLNWKLYIEVRECLVEQAIDPDDIKRAFREMAADEYWQDKITMFKVCKNPHLIREYMRKTVKHDRFARNMPAQPRGGLTAVDF